MEHYIKNPKLIKLDFDDEDIFGGTDFISLVENPAIEEDFFAFKKMEFASYSDYPKAVSAAAQRGIRLNEKVGNKCATRVGKIRAQQLAQGKPITEQTIRRMFAYLSRAKEYYNPNDTEACGTISFLLWGGEPALRWSERKLAQIEREREDLVENEIEDAVIKNYFTKLVEILDFIEGLPVFATPQEAEEYGKQFGLEGYHTHVIDEVMVYMPGTEHDEAVDALIRDIEGEFKRKKCDYNNTEVFSNVVRDGDNDTQVKTLFSVADGDKQMIVSPVMVPNKPILRVDEKGDYYYIYFTPDTIERMAHKFLKDGYSQNINLEHDQDMKLTGIAVVESWIKTDEGDKSAKFGFNDMPAGTWFVQMKVYDENLWKMVKSGEVKGLSLEGIFKQNNIKQ